MANNTQYRVRCQTCGELFVWSDSEPTECPNDGGHSLVSGCIAIISHKAFGCHVVAAAPGVTNDETEGYRVGSCWYDTAGDKAYTCVDATEDAAVWIDVTAGGGAVSKAVDHTWEGDGTHNRVIDLGDDYNIIRILTEESYNQSTSHHGFSYAFDGVYGTFFQAGSSYFSHSCQALNDEQFQGKMSGDDVNKIKTGTNGTKGGGVNVDGKTYRLIGLKFSSME